MNITDWDRIFKYPSAQKCNPSPQIPGIWDTFVIVKGTETISAITHTKSYLMLSINFLL